MSGESIRERQLLRQAPGRLRVAVNGRFLLRRQTGVDRFARELCRAIDDTLVEAPETVPELRMRILVPGPELPSERFRRIEIQPVGTRSGQLWEQWELARAIAPSEILVSLCNTAPLLGSRQVVAIHDAATVAVPQAFSRAFRSWYRLLMPLLGRRADAVLTVSEFSRGELTAKFGVPARKIAVVSEGGEHILRTRSDPGVLSRHRLGQRPFVLAVSSMAAHKNFALVLEALKRLPHGLPFDVAIAGGANPRVFGDAGMAGDERVKWLGFVEDGELRALYEAAMCFVFPSIYEGFGIPPLEAMHCGCPVLASTAASIPEVCGDAAVYFDPHSPDELARALQRVAEDAGLRRELRERGFVQCRKFSWRIGASQLLDACRTLGSAVR